MGPWEAYLNLNSMCCYEHGNKQLAVHRPAEERYLCIKRPLLSEEVSLSLSLSLIEDTAKEWMNATLNSLTLPPPSQPSPLRSHSFLPSEQFFHSFLFFSAPFFTFSVGSLVLDLVQLV